MVFVYCLLPAERESAVMRGCRLLGEESHRNAMTIPGNRGAAQTHNHHFSIIVRLQLAKASPSGSFRMGSFENEASERKGGYDYERFLFMAEIYPLNCNRNYIC